MYVQLAATGLDLSRATGFNNHSTRYEGTIITIRQFYSNIRPWGLPESRAYYTYEIDWLEESKFKIQTVAQENLTHRLLQDRHGELVAATRVCILNRVVTGIRP